MRPFSYILTVFFLGSVLFHIVLIFFEPPDFLDPELILPDFSQSGGEKMQIKLMDGGQSEAFLSSQAQDNQNSDSLADSLDVDQEKWGELLERLKNNSNLTSAFKQVFEDFRPDSSNPAPYDSFVGSTGHTHSARFHDLSCLPAQSVRLSVLSISRARVRARKQERRSDDRPQGR